MKSFIIAFLLLVPGGAALAAPSWKVEAEKKIYYAQTPRLSVSLNPIEADESAWDMLNISLSFQIADAKAEVAELKKSNPGYSITKAQVSRIGSYVLQIPSLGINTTVEVKPGVEGPYFNWQYLVPKKYSANARAAFANLSTFVSVSGGLSALVPFETVVESVTVPGSICQDLVAQGSDIYHVALALPVVEKKIQVLAKEEANRKTLLEQVLRNCLELRRSAYVYDFAALLSLKVDEPYVNKEFTAELKRTIQQEQMIPLRYRLEKE